MKFIPRHILFLGLTVGSVLLVPAAAQTKVPSQKQIPMVSSEYVQVKNSVTGPLLTLHLTNVEVKRGLDLIMAKGMISFSLSGTIPNKGVVKRFDCINCSPVEALQQFCKAAGLVAIQTNTWLIAPQASRTPQPQAVSVPEKPLVKAKAPIIQLNFDAVDVRALVEIIAQNFNLKVQMDDSVTGTLDSINLHSITPEQAVEKIAEAANLSVRRENGVLLLSVAKSAQ